MPLESGRLDAQGREGARRPAPFSRLVVQSQKWLPRSPRRLGHAFSWPPSTATSLSFALVPLSPPTILAANGLAFATLRSAIHGSVAFTAEPATRYTLWTMQTSFGCGWRKLRQDGRPCSTYCSSAILPSAPFAAITRPSARALRYPRPSPSSEVQRIKGFETSRTCNIHLYDPNPPVSFLLPSFTPRPKLSS